MGLPSLAHFPVHEIVSLHNPGSDIQHDVVDPDSDSPNVWLRTPRVLVVDDERLVADTLSQILKRFQYDAIPFYNGETAIQAAREQCPDFVLSDVIMPRLN